MTGERSTSLASSDKATDPSKAIYRHYRVMRLSLHCIDSTAHWVIPEDKRVDHPFPMVVQGGILALRTRGDEKLHFVARQMLIPYFDADGEEFRCRTDEYQYTLSNIDGSEILSWHWHPDKRPEPHVHVEALDRRLHIPTGRVAFESVIRFLIEDFDVPPAREDWDAVLAEQYARHKSFRSWA